MARSAKRRKKHLRKCVAGFGAAMSALAAAQPADAAVVPLTPAPNPVPGGVNTSVSLGLGGPTIDFYQFNNGIGKTLYGNTFFDVYGFRAAAASSTITTGQVFTYYLTIGTSANGTATYGFLTNAGQVGWIRMNLGGSGGPITYLAAAIETTPGVPIRVPGTAAIPEAGTGTVFLAGLSSLALGAVGVRRLRKRRSQADQSEEEKQAP